MNQGNQAKITPRVWPIALKTTSKEMEYTCYKSKMVVPHLVMHSTVCIATIESQPTKLEVAPQQTKYSQCYL